jgi:hypothetical protein
MRVYKLFRKKGEDYFPLFINKNQPLDKEDWNEAKAHPTPSYAVRPGWHCSTLPYAPHLNRKDGTLAEDRVWVEVEIPEEVNWQVIADDSPGKCIMHDPPLGGYYRYRRNERQGSIWYIAGAIKFIREVSDEEADAINAEEGISVKIRRR